MTKALAVLALAPTASAFCLLARACHCPNTRAQQYESNYGQRQGTQTTVFATNDRDKNAGSSSSYESSASVTKGLVSSLTALTNNIFGQDDTSKIENSNNEDSVIAAIQTNSPPTSPEELLQRIQKEYTENNYLWTGNIDTSSFVSNCTFTDPTLSFTGVDNYVKNVGNLVPIVEYALGEEQISNSTLLDISLDKDKGYIQTRWNMIGELNALFWKPKIDVVGRTKFWYRQGTEEKTGNRVQVYFYDEEWEIPAGLALLQLVTPAGTIRRSDKERVKK